MKRKVLISAPYFQPVIERFAPQFKEENIDFILPDVNERLEEAELLEIISDIDGVICGDDRFTQKVLQSAPKLKVISKWGTGIDSIDQKVCKELNIAVKNTPNAFTEPVADSVFAYILSFARKTPWMDKHLKDGVWEKVPGFALNEKTLGIVGIGNIGRAVAKRAQAFGMHILGNDVREIEADVLNDLGIKMVEKDELYKQADYLSLNCDLNLTSQHLLDMTAFKKMEKKPVVINTARGPLIKEDDLVKALKEQLISGAGLDVFEHEPLPTNSPLVEMDNVLLAPHNSNSSPTAWERVHQNTVKNLIDELNAHEK